MHGCLFPPPLFLSSADSLAHEPAHRSADRRWFDTHVQEKENVFACEMEYTPASFGHRIGENSLRLTARSSSWKGHVCTRTCFATRAPCNSASRLAAGSGEEQSANRSRTAGMASGQTSSHASIDSARSAVHVAAPERRQPRAVRGL